MALPHTTGLVHIYIDRRYYNIIETFLARRFDGISGIEKRGKLKKFAELCKEVEERFRITFPRWESGRRARICVRTIVNAILGKHLTELGMLPLLSDSRKIECGNGHRPPRFVGSQKDPKTLEGSR